MRLLSPKVYLIAETMLVNDGLEQYLKDQFDIEWQSGAMTDAEKLVEANGRMCYRSWEPGLNKNVVRVRTDHKEYIENILKSRHGSVLEHSCVSFFFANVSRVFTHELVRHRAGTAISQESLRFVRLDDIGFFVPEEFKNDEHVYELVVEAIGRAEAIQKHLAEYFEIDALQFNEKKKLTSAMRRLAPDGLTTTIGWTANFRALRHVLEMRTALGAEEEIRIVFDQVAEIVTKRYPAVFQDFIKNLEGEWTPMYSKV